MLDFYSKPASTSVCSPDDEAEWTTMADTAWADATAWAGDGIAEDGTGR
jgi:hypothetical protein